MNQLRGVGGIVPGERPRRRFAPHAVAPSERVQPAGELLGLLAGGHFQRAAWVALLSSWSVTFSLNPARSGG